MEFLEKVYFYCKKIPKGKVSTYKIIAKKCGNSNASRAVGNALNKNTNFMTVPCHRVVGSDGFVGGYVNGTKRKIALLKKEGVEVSGGKVDLDKFVFRF